MSNKNNQQPAYGDDTQFLGFDIPRQNWFKLPNNWTDLTATMSSWAEQKVVEYVLRHTWGYQEYGGLKRITLDEFENGRRAADGSRMDRGVGMGKQAIISGIKRAVADGFLIEDKDDEDKGRVKKYYGLRMLPHLEEVKIIPQMYENHTPDVRSSHPRGVKTIHRSEKETLERNQEKETVNGNQKNFIGRLPDLDQPKDKTDYVAQFILNELGDAHSERFYRLVAAKVPEDVIRQTLGEIKQDGADHPARAFTHRMKLYALEQMKHQM